MAGVLYRLGRLCANRAVVVVAVWLGVVVLVRLVVWGVGAETSNDLSLPGTESQQATDLLASRFPPQQNGSSPIVFHVTKGKITDAANKQAVESSYKALAKAPHVASAPDPFANAASGLVSKDATTAFTPVLLDIPNGDVTEEIANRILDTTEPARKAGVGVSVGGNLGGVLSKSPTESSEVIGLLAAMLILALTFGSLVAMGMPIITAVVGLAIGLGLIGLLGHVVTIPTVGPTLATMIGLGVGIDYALFLVTKHRDQTAHGMERHDSIARAVATSGGAIVFAGSTVIIALLSLWVADIPLVASLGYASAVAVLTAVLAAITLLPAILSLAGRRPDALAASGPGGHRRDPEADHRAAGLRPPGQQVRARLQRAPADRDRAEPAGASQPGVRGQVQPGQGEPGRPGTQAEDADRQVQLAEVPAGVAGATAGGPPGPETPAPAGTGAAARPAGIPAAPGRPVGVAAGRPPAPAGAAGAAGAAAPGRATPAPAAPRAAPAAGRGAAGGDPGQSQGPGRAHRPGGQGQDPGPGAHQGGRPGLRGGAAVGGVPGRQAGAGRCAVGPGRHSAGSRTGRPGGRAPATGERAQRPGGRPASAGRRTGGRGRLPAAAGRLAAEASRCPQEATAAGSGGEEADRAAEAGAHRRADQGRRRRPRHRPPAGEAPGRPGQAGGRPAGLAPLHQQARGRGDLHRDPQDQAGRPQDRRPGHRDAGLGGPARHRRGRHHRLRRWGDRRQRRPGEQDLLQAGRADPGRAGPEHRAAAHRLPLPADPRAGRHDQPAVRRRRLRRPGGHLPVGLGPGPGRPLDPVRHRGDRQLRAADDVRGPVRAVHGLRGLPGKPDRPAPRRRRASTAGPSARASPPAPR